MLEKVKVALLAAIAMLLAGILFVLATEEPEVIAETVTENSTQAWTEDSLEQCAFCGAHVMEVWHAKDADGNFVHVCSKCVDEYYAEKSE